MNYFTELIKIYSSQSSFFSKKRIESGISFFMGQIGMIVFLIMNYNTIDISTIIIWSTLQFTLSGYILHKIQTQKTESNENIKRD